MNDILDSSALKSGKYYDHLEKLFLRQINHPGHRTNLMLFGDTQESHSKFIDRFEQSNSHLFLDKSVIRFRLPEDTRIISLERKMIECLGYPIPSTNIFCWFSDYFRHKPPKMIFIENTDTVFKHYNRRQKCILIFFWGLMHEFNTSLVYSFSRANQSKAVVHDQIYSKSDYYSLESYKYDDFF